MKEQQKLHSIEKKKALLNDLSKEIGNCNRCKLSRERKHIYFGEGNPNAELMFIGDVPGIEEDIEGKPFVGAAGNLIAKLIEKMGIKRHDIYWACIVKCIPPLNKYPDEDEIKTCYSFIENQVEIISPKVIIAFGDIPSQTLLKNTIPIATIRGNFYEYKGIPLMPTFHPNYLLKNPKGKQLVLDDVKKVLDKLKEEERIGDVTRVVKKYKEPYKKGDVIGQKYEIYDVLGEGGFGIVYLVYSHELKKVYAFKTFRDEYFEDEQTRNRFRKEAEVWIDLERHPYLVKAYFVDEISGRLYIAMEHIAPDEPGMNTLAGFMKSRPPDLAQSIKWAIQFCHGMEYAYSKGVKAHRDIKPANIMIDQNKTVKISDFGLAGVLPTSYVAEQDSVAGKSGSNASMQTVVGSSIGTPEYMSPEQFADLSACDERSDIYSFGIVLYQMASGGKLPYYTDNPTYRWTALKYFHQETSVPNLISSLFPVIQRCLEKEPRKRYQTFKALRADLEPLLKCETGEIVTIPELKELEAWELVNKGASLSNLDKPQEAIACYDRALQLNPSYTHAWYNKGFLLGELDKYQEAIVCYDKAIEINPQFVNAWLNRGVVLGRLNKHQEAIACYDKALQIDPNDMTAWCNKGFSLNKLGVYQEAIACYNRAHQINPHNESAWVGKGVSFGKLGSYQEAVDCYDKALQIDPMDVTTWCNKGFCLIKLGRYQEAINCFDKILKIDPMHADSWYNKGISLNETGKFQEAINCYDKALQINPNDISARINKGISLNELGIYQEAIACYDRAHQINPNNESAWFGKGASFGNMGRHQEAVDCYDKALQIDPAYIKAWYNKAGAENKLGLRQDAIHSYRRFIAIAPAQYKEKIERARHRIEELEGKG